MRIKFDNRNHSYTSDTPIDWTSVTTFVSKFKNKFDAPNQALKSSRNKKSKWYGIPPSTIEAIWQEESDRANNLGNWYHDQREADTSALDTLTINGRAIPIMKPLYDGNIKISPDQNLTEGIYPEHMVYLTSEKICGQADRVDIINGYVNILDYKTNKEIKTKGYTNWEGITKKMLNPIDHLDDCNLIHYSLQLSMYLYIILKHNTNLSPGKLTLQHVRFKEAPVRNEHGYPITLTDYQNDPIIDEITPYDVPYLKSEIISMLNHIKNSNGTL